MKGILKLSVSAIGEGIVKLFLAVLAKVFFLRKKLLRKQKNASLFMV